MQWILEIFQIDNPTEPMAFYFDSEPEFKPHEGITDRSIRFEGELNDQRQVVEFIGSTVSAWAVKPSETSDEELDELI